MPIKYNVVGARTSSGAALKYTFDSQDIALRYAYFYSGNKQFPRKPEHVGHVTMEGGSAAEVLRELIKNGNDFLRPTSLSQRFGQHIGRAFRNSTFTVDTSKLLEGLNVPTAGEPAKIITGSGDSSGVKVTAYPLDFDNLEARMLTRLLNDDSAERISLEEMLKRYADKPSTAPNCYAVFSGEAKLPGCNCLLCSLLCSLSDAEEATRRQAPAKFSAVGSATAPEPDAAEYSSQASDGVESPEPILSPATDTVGDDQITPVLGKSYYVKLVDFDQAQLIKAKVLHVSDKVVELEFTHREATYVAAYQRTLKCVKFLEEVKQ